VNQALIAKKIVALLHDPVIKALLTAGFQIKDIPSDKENEQCKAVATYILRRFIDKLREGKVDLASAIEQEAESLWEDEGTIKEADQLSTGSEAAFAHAVFAKPVDNVLFMNILDGYTLSLNGKALMEKADKNSLDMFANELAEACLSAKDGFEFHALWRALLPISVKSFTKEASLLPADTKTPFLTIYDHLYITSALTTCLTEGESPAVMVFEVKRIQEFISSSRALRDLWASSYLLSLITLYVIGKLSEEFGPDVFIKPCLLGVPLYDLFLQDKEAIYSLKTLPLYKIIAPVIPAQVMMLAPAARCTEIADKVLKYYQEAWSKVTSVIKDSVEEILDQGKFREHSERCLYGKGLDQLWKQAEELPFEVQVSWVEVPKEKNRRRDALNKLVDEGLITDTSAEEIIKLAKNVEKEEKILFELPLFERAAVRKASLVGIAPRISGIQLVKAPLKVSHRNGICTLCWRQPAVLTRPRNRYSIRTVKSEKLGIVKEGERLCLSCAVKRLLGTRKVFMNVIKSLIGTTAAKTFERSLEKYRTPAFSRAMLPIASTDTVAAMTFKLTVLKLATRNKRVFDAVECFVKKIDELVKNAYREVDIYDILFRDSFYPCRAVESTIGAVSQRADVLLKFAYINGEYLHDRGLKAFEEYGVNHNLINEALKALNKLQKTCREFIKNLSFDVCFASTEPNRYIALIRADGDDMGQLFSLTNNFEVKIRDLIPKELFSSVTSDEEKLNEIFNLVYVAGPSHLMLSSRALSSLTMEIHEECYLRGAIPVYCGGDDFLLISPPEVALILSVSLREKFAASLRNVRDDVFGVEMLIPGLGNRATQSYAIRFIHYLAPLTLELAYSFKQLEEEAKARDNLGRKDGLIITYKPRGSPGLSAWLKWTAGCTSPSRLASFILTCTSLTAEIPRAFNLSVIEYVKGGRTLRIGIEKSELRLSKQAFRDVWTNFSDILDSPSIFTLANYQFRRHSSGEDKKVRVKLEKDMKALANFLETDEKRQINVIIETLKSISALSESSNVFVWGEHL